MSIKFSTVAAAISLSLASAQAISQESASLYGKLVDQNNQSVFAGAKVEIKSLNRNSLSKTDGTFRFPNLPTGEYELTITYSGFEPITQTVTLSQGENLLPSIVLVPKGQVIDEVITRGQRSGKASAINQQKNSTNIVSVVSADGIGDFPDQNAAESLQRLPGISIERDQGEGRFVGIRGIDPNLNNVTINGLNIPSPEAGVRSVALDVIPSELIQTLEVSKSISADMDADAVGGAINVKSISAFDRTQDTTIVSLQASHNELRSETSPKASLTATRLFDDKWGVAAALSYFKRDFGSDNIESNAEDEVEQRHYAITRERIGGALNIDYRPNFNDAYFLRTLYSEFSDDEYRQANIYVLDGEDSEIERESKDREETQTIFTVSAGGEHERNQWLFDYQLGYAKSDEKEPSALYYTLVTENPSVEADLQRVIPSVSVNSDANDFSTYEVDEISFENNLAEDTEHSIQANLTRLFSAKNGLTKIKSGFKYRDREKQAIAKIDIYGGDFDDLDPTQFADVTPDYGLGDFGPGLNRGVLRSFYNQSQSVLELEELDSEIESKGASYINNEDIFAVYSMGQFDWDKVRLVAGVRYEKTDFSTSGSRVELIEDEENDIEEVVNTPWEVDRDYDHLLFSMNARYAFSDKLILRGAFAQTISRPIFEQSAAFQIIESKTEEDDGEFVTEREAEVGNPELQPYEANNFDISLEYYPDTIGVISAGIFYKQIDNFVVLADVAGTPDWVGFDEVIQPINGDEATLSGVELSWVKTFDNGLLFSVNGTFSDSEATTFLDGERFETSLPNQSDTVGNLTVGYEDNAWSLRLTMTYKSENFEEIDGDFLRYEDDHQQVDFSGKYFINDDLNLYLNVVNLTDEPFYGYFDQRNQNAQYEEYGRTIEFGFRWQL
ncbi:TonB-dependent receptor [Glaciecola sp. 1036]|uniref:TonB-dependent receptor n=1 Tax=Alteromonadaceae TaxID=72275 RepID=UPI003CFC9999